MKKKHFVLALALVLALVLTGCSANRENNSDPVNPTNSVSGNNGGQNSGAQHSDTANGGVQNSAGIGSGGNDAAQGGGVAAWSQPLQF